MRKNISFRTAGRELAPPSKFQASSLLCMLTRPRKAPMRTSTEKNSERQRTFCACKIILHQNGNVLRCPRDIGRDKGSFVLTLFSPPTNLVEMRRSISPPPGTCGPPCPTCGGPCRPGTVPKTSLMIMAGTYEKFLLWRSYLQKELFFNLL